MKQERIKALLLLPRLKVQNANTVSSPLTWGFPAPRAFTGFAHALERRLDSQGMDLSLGGVGIVCHQFEPQTVKPPGRYTQVFSLTRNPLNHEGNPQAIVEEGRAHMEVSLLITVSGDGCPLDDGQYEALAAKILHEVEGMRLAGGSILPNPHRAKHPAQWVAWPDYEEEQSKAFFKLRRHLAPGFVLVGRSQLLADHVLDMQKERAEATALDALLDLCALHHTPPTQVISNANSTLSDGDDAADVQEVYAPVTDSKDWSVSRRKPGWLVPLPVGYAAISPLYAPGEVKNARDNDTPFRFVENVLSMGEWVGSHRIKNLHDLLWRHDAQPDAGLYITQNGTPF